MKRFSKIFLYSVFFLFTGFSIAEAQNDGNLRLRSEGQTLFDQAIAARRAGKLSDAFRLYEQAVTSDRRMLFFPDEGLAMELLGDYRRRVEQSPLSTELFRQMDQLEILILGSRDEGIKRNVRFLQNNPDPRMKPVAEAEIARFEREFKIIQAERVKRENSDPQNQVISGTGRKLPPVGISTTPDPENTWQTRQEDNAALYYELGQLKDRITALQREKMEAEQNFYDSYRRSSRVENSPGRERNPRDPALENMLRNQTRLSQTDVFEIRRKLNEAQSRVEAIERQLQNR